MKRALSKLFFVIGAIVIIAIVYLVIQHVFFKGRIYTDDAQIDGNLVFISPQVPGKILKVYVSDNQQVKPETLLVQLDPAPYKAKLDEARARLLLAKKRYLAALLNVSITHISTMGTLEQAKASLRSRLADEKAQLDQITKLEQEVTKSKSDLSAADARLKLAKANYTRMELLFRSYAASQEQYDTFQTAYKNAKAADEASRALLKQEYAALQQTRSQLAASRAEVAKAKASIFEHSTGPLEVRAREEELKATKAEVIQAEAAVRFAKLQLSYTAIRAPSEGIVTQKHANTGEVVAPTQQLLILSPVHVWVTANFKETDLTHMRPGDKAKIKVDAYPERNFSGTVESIGGATGAVVSLFPPENATGNFVKVVQRIPVKIVLDPNTDTKRLRAGMSVEATVFLR